MCGRYSIYESMDHYLKELAPEQIVINGYDLLPIERYNVAPSTRVEIIRPTEGGLSVDKVRWGWEPFWAKGKRPAPINARVETVMTGKFFKELWPTGRAVAPANGWFEWVKDPDDPKKKQPYFIRLKSKKPMFFAALAQVHRGLEPHDGDGFVIITSASDSGMVDIHDRRPVVLTAEDARAWLDSKTTPQKAEALAKEHCRIVDDFEWFTVDRAVGNVRNQGPELIQPVEL
ncbi:SOS response-associated peptidase family protein [Pseudomonas syringae pv. actinidiae]|nr:SOS response-associated peptidase family protein [Pseudomonas syringae pv. actinidiae]MDU8280593.1 SOS response-associated peptidase family protein [Pseudomonas syringae pv. actinidiae]MDU8301920.1 SOS response-associated peptidase family protein [Pseudomonas syringae pv. actinidiae]